MGVVFRFMKQITLGSLLIYLSIFSLLFALFLVYALSGVVRDRAVRDLAREDAQQTSQLVFQSLYSAMRKGWSKQEITEIIARLNAALPDVSIRVYRGEIVERQFGAMPGEHAVIAADPVLAGALRDGKDVILFPDQATLRYLYPLRATQECLVCHTQSHVGAVHGVIDITYPTGNLHKSLNQMIAPIVIYGLLMMGLVLVLLYFMLRKMVALPITNLVGVMKKISHETDFSHRVAGNRWIVELQHLAEHFNRLLGTVQEYNRQIEELAVRDPLTGVYNRRKFEEVLDSEIVRAERQQQGFSIIMADLDDFKSINDTYGHPVGDIALKKLTLLLDSSLRKGDLLARMGGDEFAVILPATTAASALQVAKKLHHTLAGEDLELPVGKVKLVASFGVVSYPEDGKDKMELLTAMDAVLYQAKALGKNQVVATASGQDNTMRSIFQQGDFLQRALREDRIEAYLHSIVDVRNGDIFAYEVLARIRHEGAVIEAEQLIKVAEDLGMIREIDKRMFQQGLQHINRMQEKHQQAKLFFNLSARTFGDSAWMLSIPDQLAQSGIPCDRVVLEITEREALPHLNQIRGVIDELRHKGIAFALDDFGSGFSSFMYLKYLAVDYVKIEGSFVRQMAVDERDRIMVTHIHQVAKEFGLKTVAEFVEDEETAKILAEIGVDYAQGYYYGHPAAATAS